MSRTIEFNRANPCPLCGRITRCSQTQDGLHFCKDNHTGDVPGWDFFGISRDGDWGLYRANGDERRPVAVNEEQQQQQRKAEQWDNWEAWAEGVGATRETIRGKKPAYERLRAMLPAFANNTFDELDIVFLPGYVSDNRLAAGFGFPECNGDGEVIGYNFRLPGGKKQSAGSRGITIPAHLRKWAVDDKTPARWDRPGPLFIVEGASDVLAMCEMGLDAIGRPSNVGGAEELAEWIAKHVPLWRRDVIVLAENDRKEDGRFPGLDGARRVSQALANLLGITIRWAMPPASAKDVRGWFEAEVKKAGNTPRLCGYLWLDQVTQHTTPVMPGRDLLPMTHTTDNQPQGLETPEMQQELMKLGNAIAKILEETATLKAAEAEVAKAVASARADHDREHGMRCERCRSVILHDLTTNGPRVQFLRCENYVRCGGCGRWRIFREEANARLRFSMHASTGGALYERLVNAADWNALRRRINRQGGQYHRTHEDCSGEVYYVVTTVHVPGSILVPAPVAASTVHLLLTEYEGQPRPVATSHAWKLPQVEARTDRFRRVGMGSRWLNMHVLSQIAEAVGCGVELHVAEDGQSRCVVACDLYSHTTRTWNDSDRDYAFDCLLAGEVLARLDHTTFTSKPIAAATDPAESIPW